MYFVSVFTCMIIQSHQNLAYKKMQMSYKIIHFLIFHYKLFFHSFFSKYLQFLINQFNYRICISFNLSSMNLKYIFLLFLLSWISYCKFPECKKTDYTYITFSLTWVSQFCSTSGINCNDQKLPFLGDGSRPLSIHGFWPSSLDLAYLGCQRQHKKDYYCYTNFKFNKGLFSQEEIDLLQQYWPDLQNKGFWQHEWDTHGTCYLNILKQKRKSTLSPKQIFRDYFLGTIEKVINLNILLPAATSIPTQADLAQLINLNPSQFYAVCSGKHYLSEIRICYDISNEPKKQKIRSCPPSTDPKLCVYPISLKE